MPETRIIKTGLTGPVNHAVLDSVMGQLSDGKWENTPMMRKFWKNAEIKDQDGEVVILIKDGWDSGFHGKDEAWIKDWFASKIKQIVYDEFGGERWNRKDTRESDYLSRNYGTSPVIVTVSDAYQAYELLKGRNVAKKYAAAPAPSAAATGAPAATPTATPDAVVSEMLGESGRKAVVTAQAFNRATGEPNGVARDEEVDLDTNRLFKGCNSWLDVKRAYESFWNDLNPNSEDVVFVSAVKMPGAAEQKAQTPMDKFTAKHVRKPKFPAAR